ncbi:hypothetical protein OAU50_04335 [Planctomycetota bacterium]|nr:hypothetical protein [Planctomycetota bacterium]
MSWLIPSSYALGPALSLMKCKAANMAKDACTEYVGTLGILGWYHAGMTDERGHELQNRWKETGSVDDEVAWLTHRMEQGTVVPHRVSVAAVLGHKASQLVLEMNDDTPSSLDEVLKTLDVEFQAKVRASIAVLRLSLSFLTGRNSAPWITEHCAAVLHTSQNWALDPSEKTAKAAYEVAVSIDSRADAAEEASTDVGDWWSYQAVQAAHFIPAAIALAAELPEPFPDDPLGPDYKDLLDRACWEFAEFPSNVDRSEEQAVAVISKDLIPWLLGYSDPIQDRVGV